MDKKSVVEELNYIFNVIKSSFDPIAFVRYLTATTKWNEYIHGMAKSHGLVLKKDLNIDKLIESAVQKRFADQLAPDQIEDLAVWIKVKIFYPKAEEKVEMEDGVKLDKGRNRKDVFEVLEKEKSPEAKDLAGLEGQFVNLIKSMTNNLIGNYLDEKKRLKEQLGDQALISDIDEDGIENDLDRLPSVIDEVENMTYKDLVEKAGKFIKDNGKEIEKKVFDLRMKDLTLEEIGEKLKLDKSRLSGVLKDIRKVLHLFAAKNDLDELREKIENLMERFKDIKEKKSSEEVLESVVASLESLFVEKKKEVNPKIAKITEYLDELSFRIQTRL